MACNSLFLLLLLYFFFFILRSYIIMKKYRKPEKIIPTKQIILFSSITCPLETLLFHLSMKVSKIKAAIKIINHTPIENSNKINSNIKWNNQRTKRVLLPTFSITGTLMQILKSHNIFFFT